MDIDDETGDFGTCHITDSFLHQRDAGRGGGSHDSFSRSATSVEHVDGCHFALCLQYNHSGGFPRLNFGKRFEHFALRRDGIAKVAVTATSDGGVGNGFVALHQHYFFFCHNVSFSLTFNSFLVNSYAAVWTYDAARCAPDALVRAYSHHIGVAMNVNILLSQRYHTFRTGFHA